MAPSIRLAAEDAAGAIRAIHAPSCAEGSHVSFEVEPPSIEEARRRIARTLDG